MIGSSGEARVRGLVGWRDNLFARYGEFADRKDLILVMIGP